MTKDYKPRDIVLLSFSFSNSEAIKKRPALVLLDTGDNDIIVARITSKNLNSSFDIPITELKVSGLILPSVVRLHKTATLDNNLVTKKLGKLGNADFADLKKRIRELWKAYL
jgi:mRNA interferase MazF